MMKNRKSKILLMSASLFLGSNLNAYLVDGMGEFFKALITAPFKISGYSTAATLGLVGGLLLVDGVVDGKSRLDWRATQKKRKAYEKNALDFARDFDITFSNLGQKSAEKFPGYGPVATRPSIRGIKILGGAALIAGGLLMAKSTSKL